MKLFLCALLVAQAVLQITNAQVIRTIAGPLNPCGCGCGCGGPLIQAPLIQNAPIIQSAPLISSIGSPLVVNNNNVAASLADTLSLLTVSSLLADTLPLGPNVVSLPVGGCGCGGCGCGGLGYGGYYY